VRATQRAAKPEVTVGEAFFVEVEAEGPPGATFTFPPQVEGEKAELVPPAIVASPAEAGTPAAPATPPPANRHRYEARVFALGEATLPDVTVRYRLADGTQGEAVAPGVGVKVASLLPKGEEQAPIADIKPPVEVGVAPVFWAALVALLAALLGLFVLAWRRWRRPRPSGASLPVPEVPPDVEARQAIEALVRADHFGRGDGRGYYIALSAIAKRYLERRLAAPVLEMTTAEMLAFLRESQAGEGLVGVMRDLALLADQVKFAKGEAQREEGERHRESVLRLVAGLEERLRPSLPEPPGASRAKGEKAA
jgi:hypothetical protein